MTYSKFGLSVSEEGHIGKIRFIALRILEHQPEAMNYDTGYTDKLTPSGNS